MGTYVSHVQVDEQEGADTQNGRSGGLKAKSYSLVFMVQYFKLEHSALISGVA